MFILPQKTLEPALCMCRKCYRKKLSCYRGQWVKLLSTLSSQPIIMHGFTQPCNDLITVTTRVLRLLLGRLSQRFCCKSLSNSLLCLLFTLWLY